MKEIITICIFACLALFSVNSKAFYGDVLKESPLYGLSDIYRDGEPRRVYFGDQVGIVICPNTSGVYSDVLKTTDCLTLYFGSFSKLCEAQVNHIQSTSKRNIAGRIGLAIILPPTGALSAAAMVGGGLYAGKEHLDIMGSECTPEGIKKGDEYLDKHFVEELIKEGIQDGDTTALIEHSATGIYTHMKKLFPEETYYPVKVSKYPNGSLGFAYEIEIIDDTKGLVTK